MPVSYLELENFKSYAGLQRIGPFRDFTCIIGPNGAGKSNIMDAIAFLFGVQSRDLRSSQMKDLIFRPPGGLRNDDDGDDDDNDEDGDGDADDERNAPAKRKSQKSKIATTTTTTTKLKATATLVYHDDEQDREYRFSPNAFDRCTNLYSHNSNKAPAHPAVPSVLPGQTRAGRYHYPHW